MTIHIDINDADAERAAIMLANETGVSVDRVVADLLKRHMTSIHQSQKPLLDRIADIQQYVATLPVIDPRTPDEILGYNKSGALPHGD